MNEGKRSLRLKFSDISPERRAFLKGGALVGGTVAAGITLGGLLGRLFPNVRAADPTVGSAALDFLSLVPRSSRPAAAPTGAFWEDLSHRGRLWDGSIDQILEQQSNRGIASGYADLDSSVLVPRARLGTGTADNTKFLRGDATWQPGTTSVHNILSATHGDANAGAVARGDVPYGKGATPAWDRLPLGANNQFLGSNGTDLVWATPPGAAGSYYGVRAETYITSGTGTDADPYNASAVESAINALPGKGGIVFVKDGIWSGSRILLGGSGQAGRGKHILLRGEGANLSYAASEGPPNESAQVGTHLQCGFDVKLSTCTADFSNLVLSPPRGSYLTPTLKFIRDGADLLFGQQRDLGGFRVMDCKFQNGHPAIWNTGINIASHPDPVMQTWMVLIERCMFIGGGTGIKIDDGGAFPLSSSFAVGAIRQINMNARGFSNNTRAFDMDILNVGALTLEDWLIEGGGGTTTDYAIYIKVARAESGFTIRNIYTGDGTNALKEARIEQSLSGGQARGLFFISKDVDLVGYGDYEIGTSWSSSNVINVTAGGTDPGGIILHQAQGNRLALGTIVNPNNLLVIRNPAATGFVGSTTLGTSPATYTNGDSRMICAQIVGGTITDVSRNSQSVGTERTHVLAPGQSIVVTYSAGSPVVKRFGIS